MPVVAACRPCSSARGETRTRAPREGKGILSPPCLPAPPPGPRALSAVSPGLPRPALRRAGCRAPTPVSSSAPVARITSADDRAGHDRRRPLGHEPAHPAPLGERERGQPREQRLDRRRWQTVPVDQLGDLALEAEVEGRKRRDGAGDADELRGRGWSGARAEAAAASSAAPPLGGRGRVGVQESLRHRTQPMSRLGASTTPSGPAEHELGGAAADVADERRRHRIEPRRDAAVGELGLLTAREEARLEAVPPLNLGQELGPVRRIADGARRRGHHAFGVELGAHGRRSGRARRAPAPSRRRPGARRRRPGRRAA